MGDEGKETSMLGIPTDFTNLKLQKELTRTCTANMAYGLRIPFTSLRVLCVFATSMWLLEASHAP
jgi:hypothetical protein